MSRSARRNRGLAQNIANQLAQMATGWEISFDGPALIAEPDVGVITIDVVAGSAQVNGHPAPVGMTSTLRAWTAKELERQGRDWSWLHSAQVTIRYTRSATPFNETRSVVSDAWKPWTDHGLFDATASVSTEQGEAQARSHNDQPLLRVRKLPDGTHGGEIAVKEPF